MNHEKTESSDLLSSNESIGAALRVYRTQILRYSQTAMAERLGCSRSTLVRMEQGDPRIPIGVWLAAWSRVYQNPVTRQTVLQAVIQVAGDHRDAVARDRMVAAAKACGEPINPLLSADAADDREIAQQSVWEWMQTRAPGSPVNDDSEDTEYHSP